MKAELLLARFDRISNAPDAVPRLRRLILDLAVRGKLVEQDPSAESAGSLVQRIRQEKLKAIERGQERKEKPLPPLDADERPFLIPVGWSWSQLAEIGFLNPRNTADDKTPASFVPMSMISTEYGTANLDEVRPWGEIKSGFTHFADGDVGLAKITPCFENGKSTVFRNLKGGIGAGTTELHVVRPVLISADYILIFLKSPHFIDSGIPRMTGTAGQKRVPTEYFAYSPFPLPPLAEQHRIVDKVDELMALCDRLEAAQRERESRRDGLTASTHHHLNNGADAEVLRSHAQFFIGHLPRLTARPDQIKQLRQTILNLAIRGRLSSREPNEEPALTLLRWIEKRRAFLYAERKIPKPHSVPPIEPDQLPFSAPLGWEWTMLGRLCYQVSDGPHFSPQYVSQAEGIPFLSTRNVRVEKFDLANLKYVSKEDHHSFCKRVKPEPGDVLYTKGGTTGIARVNDLPFEFSVWVHIAVLKIAKEHISPHYVALALNSPLCYEQSQTYTQGISNFDLGLTRMIKNWVSI
jgi:type I restriction enzyme S subunit